MPRVVLIFFGGGLGSAARYGCSVWAARAFGAAFPYGTLLVNVVGSLLMGALVALEPRGSVDLRLALGTGFLGGFTTYSAFNHETLLFARQGSPALAVANVAITLFACLASGAAGFAAVRSFVS